MVAAAAARTAALGDCMSVWRAPLDSTGANKGPPVSVLAARHITCNPTYVHTKESREATA